MTPSDQTDSELYYEVQPQEDGFVVVHKASAITTTAQLGCLEATAEAERLTAEAHRLAEAYR